MKKKVALLLAFVMVLSLMPMNVFGARGSVAPRLLDPTSRSAAGVNAWQQFTVSINADDFAGLATTGGALYIRFALSAGNNRENHASEVAFRADNGSRPDSAPHPAALSPSQRAIGTSGYRVWDSTLQSVDEDGNLMYDEEGDPIMDGAYGPVQATPATGANFIRWTGLPGGWTAGLQNAALAPGSTVRELFVPLYAIQSALYNGTNLIFPSLTETFAAQINMAVRHRDARLTVDVVRQLPGQPLHVERNLVAQDLMLAARDYGITGSAGDPIAVVTHAVLPQIRVDESTIGELTGGSVGIRLVAPRGFRWDTDVIGGIGGDFGISNNAGISGLGAVSHYIHFNTSTQRDELNIFLSNVQRSTTVVGQTTRARINVNNTRLIATALAPTSGDINIDMYVRVGNPAVGATGGLVVIDPATGDPVGSHLWARNAFALSGHNLDVLPVPVRTNGDEGDDLDWAEAGILVGFRGEAAILVYAREPIVGISGTRSADWNRSGVAADWMTRNFYSIRLQDGTPNAMMAATHEIEFYLPQDGVRFENVQLRHGTDVDRRDDYASWVNFDSATAAEFTLPALTSLDRDTFRLTPRPAPGTDTNQLDLRFQIITEAGFEARFGGEVEVRVTGPGGLEETVVIAIVEDPIRVLPAQVMTVERTDGFGVLVPTVIHPVSVQELEIGAFEVGDIIRPHVRTVMDGRPVVLAGIAQPVLNVAAAPTVDAGSGLILRVRPGSNNLEWEVVRPSLDGPATITFSHITITGALLPGIEYHVEIASSRIARTSTHFSGGVDGRTAATVPPTGDTLGIWLGGISESFRRSDVREDIRFDGLTYSTLVVQVAGEPDFDGDFVGPDIPGFERPTFQPLPLTVGMSIFSPSDNAMIDPAVILYGGAMKIAVRAFGDHINADVMNWNPATSEVTLSAIAADGIRITVVLTVGSNQARITNHATGVVLDVDIASWVIQQGTGQDSGPATSVRTVNVGGRTYLPARFLAYLFGMDVTWNPATQVASITPRAA